MCSQADGDMVERGTERVLSRQILCVCARVQFRWLCVCVCVHALLLCVKWVRIWQQEGKEEGKDKSGVFERFAALHARNLCGCGGARKRGRASVSFVLC